jgi:hypothetical protein
MSDQCKPIFMIVWQEVPLNRGAIDKAVVSPVGRRKPT